MLVIGGPTATGKSEAALVLAEKLSGEIISADSMQVYRHLDIGTAKPSSEETIRVRHHLMNVVEPEEGFTAARFADEVHQVVPGILKRGHLPIMVGGTGLYIRAAISDFLFPSPGRDEQYRSRLENEALKHGSDVLHEYLAKVDPQSAARIHPNDRVRIIRALEVHHLTGVPLSNHFALRREQPIYNNLNICLTRDRDELYERINQRTHRMMEEGFVQEVRDLISRGYRTDTGPLTGLGYAEITSYLHGLSTYEEMLRLIQRNTRRYAKRQLSWFRHEDDWIWINMSNRDMCGIVDEIAELAAGRFCRNGE